MVYTPPRPMCASVENVCASDCELLYSKRGGVEAPVALSTIATAIATWLGALSCQTGSPEGGGGYRASDDTPVERHVVQAEDTVWVFILSVQEMVSALQVGRIIRADALFCLVGQSSGLHKEREDRAQGKSCLDHLLYNVLLRGIPTVLSKKACHTDNGSQLPLPKLGRFATVAVGHGGCTIAG